jgi:hypothetical protein
MKNPVPSRRRLCGSLQADPRTSDGSLENERIDDTIAAKIMSLVSVIFLAKPTMEAQGVKG